MGKSELVEDPPQVLEGSVLTLEEISLEELPGKPFQQLITDRPRKGCTSLYDSLDSCLSLSGMPRAAAPFVF